MSFIAVVVYCCFLWLCCLIVSGKVNITSCAMLSDSEEEIFCGPTSGREARCRLRLPRHTLDVAPAVFSDSSLELIEAQSEPEFPSGVCSSPSPPSSLSPRRRDTDDLDTTLDRIDAILRSGGQRLEPRSPVSSSIDSVEQLFENTSLKTPAFKSPAGVPRMKKLLHQTTPRKPDAQKQFENIASPVAYYINNSPQVPLFRTVRPMKPLSAQSGIPKPVFDPARAKGKENFVLPPKAYKYAKETKVIESPAQKQLPQNKQVKKMASGLPQPLVMRHERRERCEVSAGAPLPRPDDSFAGLTLAQADLSVCVVKAATTTHTLKPIPRSQ